MTWVVSFETQPIQEVRFGSAFDQCRDIWRDTHIWLRDNCKDVVKHGVLYEPAM